MNLGLLPALLIGVTLVAVGALALVAPYHQNILRLRGAWALHIPVATRVRLPKLFGAMFLAGGLYILVDCALSRPDPASEPGSGTQLADR